jgi:hypothetical protein
VRSRLSLIVIPALTLTLALPSCLAQSQLEAAVAAKYPLTKTTADMSDIVTAGSVVVLKKDGLLMYALNAPAPAKETYKNGRFNASALTKFTGFHALGSTTTSTVQRTFVAGEKFWITGISTDNDGLVLKVYSDPINDIRYMAYIKFPFAKGTFPPADQMLAQIGEALQVDGAIADTPAPAAAPAAAPAPVAAMAPIAPPPPPPDEPAAPPQTVNLGDKKEAVIAAFGQPARVVKLGPKEILYFKDMKVTFVNGKVTDVQ